MGKIAEKYIHLVDFINKFTSILIYCIFLISLGVILLSILSRYIFSIPLGWVEESSKYLIFYLVFIGAGIAARTDRLIRLSFLPDVILKNKFKNNKFFDVLSALFSIMFYILAIVYSIQMMFNNADQVSLSLGIKMNIVFAAIPIGCFLLILNTIANLLGKLLPMQDQEVVRP